MRLHILPLALAYGNSHKPEQDKHNLNYTKLIYRRMDLFLRTRFFYLISSLRIFF